MMDRSALTRRQTMAGAAALALSASSARASERATGMVYESVSGERIGIPDVAVSNGRDVVLTDRQGRYGLDVSDGDTVFVVKPPGFALPRDENNIPRFSYLHQPQGTPPELRLRYRGIDPTGPLPASIDFALSRQAEPDAFEVILFTDPQPESPVELGHVRDTAVTRVLGTKAAFGMTTGDILFDDLSFYGRSNRIMGRIGIPWFHIGGNHDLNFEAPDARYSRETFKRVYGAPYYAFHRGKALFLMLDTVHYLGAASGVGDGVGRYEGRIGERQLAFVANMLAQTPKDRLVVIAMHIPLYTDLNPDDPRQNVMDRERLLDLLGDRPVLSLAGHTHTTEHHYPRAGGAGSHHHHVLTAVSGSWWSGPSSRTGIPSADSRDGTPNGFHVLSMDGAGYTTRYRPAQGEPDEGMRIVLESQYRGGAGEVLRDYRPMQTLRSPVPRESLSATNLVVNVFDGGPRTRVSYRIGSGPAVAMVRTRRPDPFVNEVYLRYPEAKKPWVKAEPSSHIWVARLDGDIPAGSHRITVDVEDEYGRPLSSGLVLEVTGEVGSSRG
ncbi:MULTISPECIES: calcineurin-like phosphoesterase family protein [unclassified Methylobacterium]|uniref:calcineurin-like phosphoesterase C-terminal domain-containing protein n=1 Tax=unclassified Methylobacterium TaxID=2615210 RepID=UPI0006FE6032|nr:MULTISPECIES: calcineurin-like phosphoesterase family protein [unclassified Methylobacterium]KQO45541.1 Cna protein B-type domain containing protein [Methylobacterium sp. Leaf86]KQO92661.1 Cna protein B-type domain containing protein [Methylobacterium sp. Leaf91]